jgi:dihydrofolate synthase/folylpolyglutamate synthase
LQLASILDELSPDKSDEGYLSPSGLFTLMGLRYMIDAGCDVAVLEAGMGGKSDEVSLFPPSVVAVTSIFGEHLGVLGKDIVEIAQEKIGVVADSTKAVLTIPQSPAVSEVIAKELKKYRCDLTVIKESSSPHGINLPPGLSGHNAVLGIQAGHRLLELQKLSVAKHESLQRVLSTIKTPGRLSLHEDQTGRTWVVDAAINESGVASALEWTKHRLGRVDTVLVSIPSGKDVAGVRRVLDHHPYVPVRISTEHLNFDNNEWGTDLISFEEIDQHITGTRILAVGTWSFVGAVLDRLGVNYEVAYSK